MFQLHESTPPRPRDLIDAAVLIITFALGRGDLHDAIPYFGLFHADPLSYLLYPFTA